MKKGPLSKTEKSYIAKNYENMTTTLMADEMGRSVHMVDKYITKLGSEPKKKEKAEQDKESLAQTTAPAIDSSSLYVRDKNKVATIKTEAASSASDESRKKAKMPSRYKGMIHKIKEN